MNRKIPIKKGEITEFFVKVSESDYLFYLLLALNILLLCSTRFFPTADGPSHVYNAAIIKELVLGNELFGHYYEFNHFFTPNWGTHFLLSIVHLFFSSWMVEKNLFYLLYSRHGSLLPLPYTANQSFGEIPKCIHFSRHLHISIVNGVL